MVELKNIYKAYGKNQVLKGIGLQVEKGEVVVILGPSGSGKTTLLRSINFLDHADSGSVTVDGLTVDCAHAGKKEILALRKRTAMVFQHYNLFNNKTVLENVMEGLIVAQKMPKQEARERSLAMLRKVGMEEKIDVYPAQISGGQQQRVGIARALVLNPEIILFDEPTSALDPEMVGEVLECIKGVAREGITMIVVTHEMGFAREVANRVVFIEGGNIVEQGSPNDVFNHPRQERTRQFLSRITRSWNRAEEEEAGPSGPRGSGGASRAGPADGGNRLTVKFQLHSYGGVHRSRARFSGTLFQKPLERAKNLTIQEKPS